MAEETGTLTAVSRTQTPPPEPEWLAAGYAGTCRVVAPNVPAAFPPAPAWRPCDVSQPIDGCEQLSFPVETTADGQSGGQVLRAVGIAGAGAALAITRTASVVDGEGRERLGYETTVLDAEGALRAAFRSESCPLLPRHASGETYVFDVYDPYREQLDGVIAGEFDSLRPSRTYASRFDVVPTASLAGELGLIDAATWTLFPWDSGAASVAFPEPPWRSQLASPRVVRGHLIVGADAFDGRQWHPYLRAASDATRVVGAVASDGHDLVWAEAASEPHSAVTLKTARYSAPGKGLVDARDVRTDLAPAARAAEWVVGCGYAAGGTTMVRLEDGAVRGLPGGSVAAPFGAPIAVDCTHVYVALAPNPMAARGLAAPVDADAVAGVVRIPLSSLRD